MKYQYEDQILPKIFFEEDPEKVAVKILGKYLVRRIDEIFLVGKIVEVEAYLSTNDPAAHNFKGKTTRNKSLFSDAGKAYVHSMRQYNLIDIVTEGENLPGSVLIRALEPVEGIEIMINLAKTDVIEKLTNGPGKLCRAFDISRKHDGIDLTSAESPIFLCSLDSEIIDESIVKTTRVGLSKAQELLLRFCIKDNPFISSKILPSNK